VFLRAVGMEKERTRRSRSRATSRAATHPGLESAAAFHRDEVERQKQHSRAVQPRSRAGKQLSAWLPAHTLALCGAEVPLFLALDKLDDLAQRVRSEGQEAQTRFLRRLEASLQVRAPPTATGAGASCSSHAPTHTPPPHSRASPALCAGVDAWSGGLYGEGACCRGAGTGGGQGPGPRRTLRHPRHLA
jgi:hypothetical protein